MTQKRINKLHLDSHKVRNSRKIHKAHYVDCFVVFASLKLPRNDESYHAPSLRVLAKGKAKQSKSRKSNP